MAELFQVLTMMAVPVAFFLTIRASIGRQDRRAAGEHPQRSPVRRV